MKGPEFLSPAETGSDVQKPRWSSGAFHLLVEHPPRIAFRIIGGAILKIQACSANAPMGSAY
jgi:hypothetical protein